MLVTLDFETYYDNDYSLSTMTTESYINDSRFEVIGVSIKKDNLEPQWYPQPEVESALNNIDWSKTALLCHNTMFDGAILAWHYRHIPTLYLDTLSIARPLHGLTMRLGLKYLAEYYKLPPKGDEVVKAKGKRYSDFSQEELAAYGAYCITDTKLTYELFKLLKIGFPQDEIRMIDQTIRMFTVPHLILDKPLLDEYLIEVKTKKEELLAKIEALAGKDALMSNIQLAALLEKLGVELPTKKNKKGDITYAFAKTDKNFIALLDHEDSRVQAVVAARIGVKSTLEETRATRFADIATRAWFPVPLNYGGALVTNRHSGADNLNLQNLPKGGKLRKAIMAKPGYIIVVGDSSNIELRIAHVISGQTDTVTALREGRDLYCEFAELIFGYTVTPDMKDERFIGKQAMLSLQYGAGAEKFQETCRINAEKFKISKGKITLAEAERIVYLWRVTYSQVVAFWNRCQNSIEYMLAGTQAQVDDYGLVTTDYHRLVTKPNNMIRYPRLSREGNGYQYWNRDGFTKLYGGKCLENISQHLARNVIKDQWLKIAEQYPIVLQVHDELVAIAPEAKAEEASKFMQHVMSTPPDWWPELPLAAEVNYAYRYGDAK